MSDISHASTIIPCPNHVPNDMTFQEYEHWIDENERAGSVKVKCVVCGKEYYSENNKI